MSSDSVELFVINSPEQLNKPTVRAFVRKALATSRLILDPDAAVTELEQGLQDPRLAPIVGHEGGRWAGFVLLRASTSAFNPGVVVVHFYHDGSVAMRKALVEAVCMFADLTGMTRILGVDTNDKPEAFKRLFSVAGSPEMSGQMVIFNRTEGLL